MCARVVAVENLSFFRRNVQACQVSLEDVPIPLFESHLILQFPGDNFGLLANASAQDEDPPEPGDGREDQCGHKVSCALRSEPWNCRENLDFGQMRVDRNCGASRLVEVGQRR
jgi:hypothetical protein